MAKQRREALELEERSLTFSPSPVSSSSQLYPSHDHDHPTAVSDIPLYFVQSPNSTFSSHPNTVNHHDTTHGLLSPITTTTDHSGQNQDPKFSISSRLKPGVGSELSLYSSSRGSSNSFLRAKAGYGLFKLEHHMHDIGGGDDNDEDDDGDDDNGSSHSSLRYMCCMVQVIWKASVSFGVAMLVFYLVTRPPTPQLHVKDVKVREFSLAEGVDISGVPTKILNCNCSLGLELDNKSRVFALHLHQPTLRMDFQNLNIVISHGDEIYVEKDTLQIFRLFIGSKGKAMYAAGQTMHGMLESEMGLPLVLHVSIESHIRVVWKIVKLKFTHHAHCLVVLAKDHDIAHPKQRFVQNTTCASSTV